MLPAVLVAAALAAAFELRLLHTGQVSAYVHSVPLVLMAATLLQQAVQW